jgi:hypothetical protein
MYTSTFGMPVLWNAVETSPHGIVTAFRGPRPKSTARVVLDDGGGRPARSAASRREREREVRRVGQARLQVRGQAVRRHDVEADAGEEEDAGRPRLRVAGGEGLEHRDLAGDVEVMSARAQAAVHHRTVRVRERARAVEHDRHVLERAVDRIRVVEVEGAHR